MSILSGRFDALTGRSGDLIKNLETPGKTWRVGRYATEILWNGSGEIGMGPQKKGLARVQSGV